MKRVTIYDVAKEADVSLATVSRVINGAEVVKSVTRKKVEDAIEKLGYKPNAIAQGLALQKTTTIGLILPETSFTYTGQVINGILDVAKIYKFKVNLHTMTDGINDITTVVNEVIKSRVDGVIVYNDSIVGDGVLELSKYHIPIVLIGNADTDSDVCSVYVDIKKATYELVKSYLEKGVDDISILQDKRNEYSIEQACLGAKKAFNEFNKEFTNFVKIPSEYRSTYKFTKEYLKENKPALFIANRDSQAMALINSAKENGIDVPTDMEVVCIIDTKYNSMVRPEISSFSIPSYDLGAVSMRVMTKLLFEEEIVDKHKKLSYIYTARKSTKK